MTSKILEIQPKIIYYDDMKAESIEGKNSYLGKIDNLIQIKNCGMSDLLSAPVTQSYWNGLFIIVNNVDYFKKCDFIIFINHYLQDDIMLKKTKIYITNTLENCELYGSNICEPNHVGLEVYIKCQNKKELAKIKLML